MAPDAFLVQQTLRLLYTLVLMLLQDRLGIRSLDDQRDSIDTTVRNIQANLSALGR